MSNKELEVEEVYEKTPYEILSDIQMEMNVPKNLRNSFGNYNYRNCETILEVAKPICHKNRCTLVLNDYVTNLGDRYYVQATAKLHFWDSGVDIINTAYAREEEIKKGMDGSQITGTASSYARKYALNGLFNLDDNKDADTDEYYQQTHKEDKYGVSDRQVEEVKKFYTDDVIQAVLKKYNCKTIKDLPMEVVALMIQKGLHNANNGSSN